MIQPQQIKKKILSPYFQPHNAVWFRGVKLQYSAKPLHYTHTVTAPSRFSPATPAKPAYPLLYFSESHDVALLEVKAIVNLSGYSRTISNPYDSWAIFNPSVRLNAILDLTDLAVQQLFATNFQELTGDWLGYWVRTLSNGSVRGVPQAAPTQILGEALYHISELQGFLTISAKAPDRKNLVIFPDKLKAPSDKIEFTDPATGIIHQIP